MEKILDVLLQMIHGGQHIPREFIVLAAAATAGVTVAVLVQRLDLRALFAPNAARVVTAYTRAPSPSGEEEEATLAVDREAAVLASLGLPPKPGLLLWIRGLSAAVPALLAYRAGLPLVAALAAGALGAIIAHAQLESRWRAFCAGVESDLPVFVSRLSASLLVTPSPIAALEQVVDTLEEGSALRAWMGAFLKGLQGPNRDAFLERAMDAAADISVSLSLVVFQIGRLLETGGVGFVEAFNTTSHLLGVILDARALTAAKAESTRGAVTMMMLIMAGILGMMLAAPEVRAGFRHPMAQAMAVAAMVIMAGGYVVMNEMINSALK